MAGVDIPTDTYRWWELTWSGYCSNNEKKLIAKGYVYYCGDKLYAARGWGLFKAPFYTQEPMDQMFLNTKTPIII